MDVLTPSSGVTKFWEWVKKEKRIEDLKKGLEMECGKGRSVIWLAKQGVEITGFDFSSFAINEAKRRAREAHADKAHFVVQEQQLHGILSRVRLILRLIALRLPILSRKTEETLLLLR